MGLFLLCVVAQTGYWLLPAAAGYRAGPGILRFGHVAVIFGRRRPNSAGRGDKVLAVGLHFLEL
jgi:hypothetical protein